MDNNKKNNQSGERLTFFQLFKEKEYQIEVPIIQRDYAQGRKSKEEVRNLFIDALYNYLLENKKHRDLDFVYGSLQNINRDKITKFIPLDGQQRLTTLFLLHWYLANKDEDFETFKSYLVTNDKSNFSYKTRTSSSEFCDAILNNNIDLNNLLEADTDKENCLSKTIQDSGWYYSSWESDPTIKSMLVMIDTIHYKFKDTTGFYNRLVNDDNPVITFQFLNLEEFKLTDDLYIKMNARGKPLTPFENFKAKFEQLIKNTTFTNAPNFKLVFNEVEKEVAVQEYFSNKIDTDWANLFWNYKNSKNVFDDKIMNLIKTKAITYYANLNENKTVKELIDRDEKLEGISFQKYTDLGGFSEKFILDFISFLDLVTNGNEKVKKVLDNKFYYDEDVLFEKALNDDFDNYNQRILFYGYSQYLLKWKTEEGLFDWMRILHNLTENNIYNNEKEFIRSIEGISNVLGSSNNIVVHFADNLKIDGFGTLQGKEESIKAQLIKKENWRDLILETEQHPYFKGQIIFILYFSGIEDYYKNNGRQCNWSDEEDVQFINTFKNYRVKSLSVFNEKGLVEFMDYRWRRALLSKGDFLLKEGRNYSFLINSDRDIGWRRLLLDGGDINNAGKRDFVKELFDDDDFDVLNVESSLKVIIDKSEVNDWRKGFIEIPKLIDYLGAKNYIRYISENSIYLLSLERMSGKYKEYYSYSFYLNYILSKTLNHKPFADVNYKEVSGEDYPPSIIFQGWHYDNCKIQMVVYASYIKDEFKIVVDQGDYKGNEISEILKSNKFSLLANDYSIILSEKQAKKMLETLCESFNFLANE